MSTFDKWVARYIDSCFYGHIIRTKDRQIWKFTLAELPYLISYILYVRAKIYLMLLRFGDSNFNVFI